MLWGNVIYTLFLFEQALGHLIEAASPGDELEHNSGSCCDMSAVMHTKENVSFYIMIYYYVVGKRRQRYRYIDRSWYSWF